MNLLVTTIKTAIPPSLSVLSSARKRLLERAPKLLAPI
jgi:hypothetical protein